MISLPDIELGIQQETLEHKIPWMAFCIVTKILKANLCFNGNQHRLYSTSQM